MAIFPHLEIESFVQVNDRTRLSGLKSFVSADEAAISLLEIRPTTAGSFIDVTADKYLDWAYSTDGTETVAVRVTTDGAPVTYTKDIEILTELDDHLFSTDAELVPHEPNILNFVRAGRNSFIDVHRTAQDRILTELDERKIWDINGDRLTKEDIVDIEEVNDWSKYLTLRLIFEGLSNATDDIYSQKAQKYRSMEQSASERASLRLDRDGDGNTDATPYELRSARLIRR